MSIRIYNQSFKDFTALQKYTRNLVNNIIGSNTIINKNDEYFNFFNILIQRHPYYNEIKGEGIKAFKTYRGFNNSICMYAVQKNDTENIFSWSKICKKNPKDNKKIELNHALRYSIYSQIRMFKIMNDCSKCVFCGSVDNIQVDHCGDYEFKEICDLFLKDYKKVPTTFDRCPRTNIKKFQKKDFDFQSKFQLFHSEKAEFQPLCKKCNIQKNFIKIDKYKKQKIIQPCIINFN